VLLIVVGVLQVIEGLVALFDDGYYDDGYYDDGYYDDGY
jgi:hypothetical protein